MSHTISFYNSSVQKEIDRWPTGIYAKFLRIAEQIEQSGPNLGLPYTRALGDGLFEIRAKGHEGIGRAFFVVSLIVKLSSCMGSSRRHKKLHLKKYNWPEKGSRK